MKLRNKKTGGVVQFETDIYIDTENSTYGFTSIKQLNEEWEDYEEPKGYWFINTACHEPVTFVQGGPHQSDLEIGNYFETKEDAERAVEKLKAWERLKDKGFARVLKINFRNCCIAKGKEIKFKMYSEDEEVLEDLDLLFTTEDD